MVSKIEKRCYKITSNNLPSYIGKRFDAKLKPFRVVSKPEIIGQIISIPTNKELKYKKNRIICKP